MHWIYRFADLGGYFRGLQCLAKKPPPSLPSLAPGAFGMMGTAFEELGRGGPAGLSHFFISLVSSFSCFSSPFPRPR